MSHLYVDLLNQRYKILCEMLDITIFANVTPDEKGGNAYTEMIASRTTLFDKIREIDDKIKQIPKDIISKENKKQGKVIANMENVIRRMKSLDDKNKETIDVIMMDLKSNMKSNKAKKVIHTAYQPSISLPTGRSFNA